MNPLEVSWRRFKVLLSGLPGDSAFMQILEEEREGGDWRSKLGKATGRNYHATEQMTMEELQREVS